MSHSPGPTQTPPPASALLDEPTRKNWAVGAAAPSALSEAPSGAGSARPSDRSVPDLIQRAWQKMPSAGEVAFGFTLVRELGRGAFGRVFLATQPELAGRVVALKISADLTGESRTLALLQHTNIVPVYSVHKGGTLQAVCMPYCGSNTVADILRNYRTKNHLPATGREFVDTLKGLSGPTTAPADAFPQTATHAPLVPHSETVLSRLSGWSYVRAVCWLGARLADGLAHAHDRGILHRDIKPANVLVTDDGQPMLLDFGIAEEMKARVTGGAIGGTVPYMAPEHLDEVRTGNPSADARSDVYSLGVVLYELLTGKFPFAATSAADDAGVRKMLAERRSAPPLLRPFNPEVTPGLESIVHRCLTGEPAQRYQSAAQLRDDLDCYLADQPLAVAPERSVRERVTKWARRHPRLTSSATLGVVAVGLLGVAVTGIVARQNRVAHLEAQQTYRDFLDLSKESHYLLYAREEEGKQLAEGVAKCRSLLDHYGALNNDWDQRPAFTALPPDEQRRVRRELADGCVLLARGCALRHKTGADADGLNEAIRLNERAERIAGSDSPRAVFAQRAALMNLAGRTGDAEAATRRAAGVQTRTGRDYYDLAIAEQTAGRHPAAITQFRKAQELDPKHYWAYFGEGLSHAEQGKWAEARGCYTTAIALWPTFHWAVFNRGLAYTKLGDHDAAIADLTRTVEIQPDFPDAYLARALALRAKLEYEAALLDLDKAAGLGVPHSRLHAFRTELQEAAGLVAPAGEPKDEDGWINRGIVYLGKKDTAGALEAFERAVEIAPRSANALMFKVSVLAELGKNEECLPLLDRAVKLDPDSVRAIAGRGVVRARLKQWDGARADAESALGKSATPPTLFQVAGIYARLSEHDAAYRTEAILLLGVALRAGYGFEHLPTDPELDPIRKTAEFEKLLRDVSRYQRPSATKP